MSISQPSAAILAIFRWDILSALLLSKATCFTLSTEGFPHAHKRPQDGFAIQAG
jgi:hypothetical protein